MREIKSIVIVVLFLCSFSWAAFGAPQGETIDLLMRTKKDQPVYLKGQKGATTLPQNSLVSVTINKHALSQLFLQTNLNTKTLLPALKDGLRAPYVHQVEVLESHDFLLENREVLLNVVSLVEADFVVLEGYEYEGEDPKVGFLENVIASIKSQDTQCILCVKAQGNEIVDLLDTHLLKALLPKIGAYIEAYGSTSVILDLVKFAKRNISIVSKKGNLIITRTPRKKCVKYVKLALKRMKFFLNEKGESIYPNSTNSIMLAKDLKSHNFINLLETPYKSKIKSPYDAPSGAVLIYVGGPGHAEIRTPDGFVSDYFNENARTGAPEEGMSGNSRTLKGVYINLRALGET